MRQQTASILLPPTIGATIMNFPTMKISILRRATVFVVIASFVLSNAIAVSVFAGDNQNVASKASALATYTSDLTQLGREGRLRENLSFESETARLIKVLDKGGPRQPVVLDEDKAVQN